MRKWCNSIPNEELGWFEKPISSLPHFVDFEENHQNVDLSVLLDEYIGYLKERQAYSTGIAATIKVLKKRYDKVKIQTEDTVQLTPFSIDNFMSWSPLPMWAENLSKEELVYIDSLAISVNGLHEFVYRHPLNADLSETIAEYVKTHQEYIDNCRECEFALESIDRWYLHFQGKHTDALHYVNSQNRVDDTEVIRRFQCDEPILNDMRVYKVDNSDVLTRYVNLYNPYVDYKLAERFKDLNINITYTFIPHILRFVFSSPNVFWHNAESIYGCAAATDLVLEQARNKNVGDSTMVHDKLIQMSFLLASRVIYWKDKVTDSLQENNSELPIRISEKRKGYRMRSDLLSNNPELFMIDGISLDDINAMRYANLREADVACFKSGEVGENSLFKKESNQVWGSCLLQEHYSSQDQAYESGRLLLERLSQILYRKYLNGDFLVKYDNILVYINKVFKSLAPNTEINTDVTVLKSTVSTLTGISYKKDREKIAEYLRDNNIECFYHFTEKKNIPSIKANGGLLSYKRAFDKGVKITHSKDMQSSRDIDSKLDLEDYARASFCKYLPKIEERKMAGHELVLLKISTEVAEFETTMFTDIEATHLPQNRGPLLEDLMKVNIKATQKDYCSSDDSDYLAYQAEVLIKGIIPLKYIKNIENPEIL